MLISKEQLWFIAILALVSFPPAASAQLLSGTAFAVAPGLLVTNHHVVAGCSSVDVFAVGGRRAGVVLDADEQLDLALLRVNGLRGTAARLRNPRTIHLGEPVMVFGFPLAGSLSSTGNFTSGLVSALRGLRDAAGELQITAPVQPGNSGGPLMDSSGLIIGVVQAKLDALRAAIATGDIPQNVNFAISLEVLVNFLVRNRVPFRDGRAAAPLDVARVAELAQTFTYRVECWAKSQQVESTPSIKQGRLPTCRAPYETTTWIDCVGERTFANGAKYIGEFRNGMRAGHGTLTYPDGQTYVGDWRDDKYNGQGVLTFPYGDKYVGEFKDGEYHGQGILTFSNGGKNVGKWRNGFFVGSQ